MLNFLKSEGINVQTLKHYVSLIFNRVEPFDHGQRRYQRIVQSMITAVAGKGIALVVSFIAVPLTASYLGVERYGVWVTISSLLAWLQIADLGLGNGMLNAVSETYGTDRPDHARHYVATTFWILIGIMSVLSVVLGITWYYIDWPGLFNVQSVLAKQEVAPAIAAAFLVTVLSLPLMVVEKVLNAYQESAIANYWSAAGNIASLFGIIVATQLQSSLVTLVVAFSGFILIIKLLSAFWLFGKHKPWLKPSLFAIRRNETRKLAHTSSIFFAVNIAALLIFQTDNVIIAHYLGAKSVGPYSVTYRLFSYIVMIQGLLLAPLWPAYGEAMARNDWLWIRQMLNRSLKIGMSVSIIGCILLLIFGKKIIEIWAGESMVPSTSLLVGMAAWTLLWTWGSTFACMLNGTNRVVGQAYYGIAAAILNIILSIVLVKIIGVEGVIIGSILSFLFTGAWLTVLEATMLMKQHPLEHTK